MNRSPDQKDDWYRAAGREFSYFMTLEVIHGYAGMRRVYGHSMKHVLFHAKNNVLTIIRKRSELDALSDWIEGLPESFIVAQWEQAAKHYDHLVPLLSKPLTATHWKTILSCCRRLWVEMLFAIKTGYAAERKKIMSIQKKHYALVRKVRNEINALRILDDYLGRCADIDLRLLSAEEIGTYLTDRKKPSSLVSAQRKKEYLIIMNNGAIREIAPQNIESTLNQHLPPQNYASLNEVSGMAVFPGNVSGPVRVVLKKEALGKVRKGDILVTPMTTPDFFPALHKVAGIVTDFGGVTSHASIIARERKIPCLVSTEIATKVFKDGEHLVLDTKKGIARKAKI